MDVFSLISYSDEKEMNDLLIQNWKISRHELVLKVEFDSKFISLRNIRAKARPGFNTEGMDQEEGCEYTPKLISFIKLL